MSREMYIGWSNAEPLRKRLPSFVDRTNGIQLFDADNLYPQRMRELRDGSYSAQAAVGRFADFLYGEGFVDPSLSTFVVNKKGQTLDAILRLIKDDIALNRGYGLHINYNLFGKIVEINYVDFEFIRMGLPDMWGDIFDLKVNNNWERDPYKLQQQTWYVEEFPIYTPNSLQVLDEMSDYGGIVNYPGQLYYSVPRLGKYPSSRIDVVADAAQIQADLLVFDLSAVQNGFSATTVFKYPGTFEDEEHKQKVTKKLNKHKGPKGAGSTMVVENPTGADLNLFESITLPNVVGMHAQTAKDAKSAIRESFSMPPEVMGIIPEAGMFAKANIIEAYEYVNTMTKGERLKLSSDIRSLLSNWHTPLTFTNYDIKQLVYGQPVNNTPGPTSNSANSGA